MEYYELEPTPMGSEELEAAGAKSGMVIKVHVKAGLQLGTFDHTLKIEHDDEQRESFEIAVSGRSVGDITLFGDTYDREQDQLALGNIPSSQGRAVKAFLLVKGPHREQVKLSVKSVDPAEALQVTLGDPKVSGKTVLWPLNIEIPPGTTPVSRLGSELGRLARIELETQHPELKTYTVKLRFAVTDE